MERPTTPAGVDRRRPLAVSASERTAIEARARRTGLSVSAYLRRAALDDSLPAAVDHELAAELGRVSGELAGVGETLERWLAGRPAVAASEVRALLAGVDEARLVLRALAGRV